MLGECYVTIASIANQAPNQVGVVGAFDLRPRLFSASHAIEWEFHSRSLFGFCLGFIPMGVGSRPLKRLEEFISSTPLALVHANVERRARDTDSNYAQCYRRGIVGARARCSQVARYYCVNASINFYGAAQIFENML